MQTLLVMNLSIYPMMEIEVVNCNKTEGNSYMMFTIPYLKQFSFVFEEITVKICIPPWDCQATSGNHESVSIMRQT